MMRLWEFQNGKMSVYRQKIDQDTVKNVKDQILKSCSFYGETETFEAAPTSENYSAPNWKSSIAKRHLAY